MLDGGGALRVQTGRHFQLGEFTRSVYTVKSKLNDSDDHGRYSEDHRRWGFTLLLPREQARKDKVGFLCGGARHRDQAYDDLVPEDHAQDHLQADPADPKPSKR